MTQVSVRNFMRRALPFALVIVALAQAHPALAQTATTDGTLGSKIQGALNNLVGPLLMCVTVFSTLGGVFLMVKGLLKFRETHQDPGAMRSAFTHIVAATMLIALPEAAGIGMNSIMGTNGMMFQVSDMKVMSDALDGSTASGQSQNLAQRAVSLAQVGGVRDCVNLGGGGLSSTVPCMAQNLAENVVPIGIIAVFAFVYLWGMWGLASVLLELARHSGERGGGSPPGFWTKGLTAILALTMPTLFMAVSQSILGNAGPVAETGLQTGSSLLTYNPAGGTSGILLQYAQMIGWIFRILALFGVLAFAKGLMILRGTGSHQQNATFSHAVVFMIAGIALANAKLTTCTIMGTISGFGAANTVGFCN